MRQGEADTMTDRTPGLWSIAGPDQFGDYNIHHPGDRLAIGAVVSNMRPADEVAANAEFIVTAVNSHDALLAEVGRLRAALEQIVAADHTTEADRRVNPYSDGVHYVAEIARAALSGTSSGRDPIAKEDDG